MTAVSILRRRKELLDETARPLEPIDWVNVAAGSALVAGGLLLLARKRRTGVAVAATGAALALIEHQQALRTWWQQIPAFVEHVQDLVGQVQLKVEEISAKRDSLVEALATARESIDMQRKED